MAEVNATPELRFPGFDNPLNSTLLGDIATFSKGKGISKADINKDGVLECIRYGELYTHYSEVIDKVHSKTNVPPDELVLSEANDVIIPASGETQIDIATASCVLHSGIALGGDLNIIKSRGNGVLLAYYLNNARKNEIAGLAQGISVVHLYANQLKTLTINLPESEEQQKIASFLTAVDKRIQLLQKKKAKLEEYKKGVMQKLFSREIRFRDENGNEFPDWEEKRLGEVAKIIMGQSPDSTSYNDKGEGIPLIQGNADISYRKSSPRQWTSKPTKVCNIGDLILTVRAPIGYIAKSLHRACIGRGVCSISSINSSSKEFLYQFLLSFELKWIAIGQGSTFTAISGNDIKSLKIEIPFLSEQEKIASFLSSLDQKIEQVGQQIEKMQIWKKGLLQKMFV